jgi:hypothetical protein
MVDGTDMTGAEATSFLVTIFEALDLEWEDYGRPDDLDINSAICMLQDELDGYDQPAAITLPKARIKVDKDEDGRYNVFFFVGTIEERLGE